jgi:hypothetical protein
MQEWIYKEGFKEICRNYNYTIGFSIFSIFYLFGILVLHNTSFKLY